MSERCDLDACRICTGCYHGNHGACRRTIWCDTEQVSRVCKCCGDKAATP